MVATFAFTGAAIALVFGSIMMVTATTSQLIAWASSQKLIFFLNQITLIRQLAAGSGLTTQQLKGSIKPYYGPQSLTNLMPHALLMGYSYASLFFAVLCGLGLILSFMITASSTSPPIHTH